MAANAAELSEARGSRALLSVLLMPLRTPVVRVILRRFAMAIPLLLVLSALSFVLVSVSPGDPALTLLGTEAPPETYAKVRQDLGLDEPLYQQYWDWISKAVRGDFGQSITNSQAVTK